MSFTSLFHTCLGAWSGYKGNINKSYGAPPNSPGTIASLLGASTYISGVSWASGGDTCVLWEEEAGDAWSLEVDVSLSKRLEFTGSYEGLALFLRTDVFDLGYHPCCLYFKPHKHHTVEKMKLKLNIMNIKENNVDRLNIEMHIRIFGKSKFEQI